MSMVGFENRYRGQLAVRPVQVQLTGATGASGEWTNAPGTQIHTTQWGLFKLVATCADEYSSPTAGGGIRWEITSGGNRPLDFAQGPNASTGPMLVGPGEMVVVRCTGAQPGARVRGQLTGVMSSHVGNIIQQYVPAPNPQPNSYDQTAMMSALQAIQAALERMSPPPAPAAPPFVIQGGS